MVRISPQCTRSAYSDGSEPASARLPGHAKHPVARGSNTAAGSRLRTAPAVTRLSVTRAQSTPRSRATGQVRAAEPALALAAARAAAFAVDNARLGAEVCQQAAAVRESRRRLLTAGDAERRALEARLRAGPAGRLQRVDQTLAGLAEDRVAAEIRGQLAVALDDLARLARGLFPGALAAHPVEKVLREIADGMPIPVNLATSGPLDRLPDEQRALAYFFCAECLANIARHAGATTATVQVRLDGGHLTMSVLDDGRGGAMLLVLAACAGWLTGSRSPAAA
jgi:signal transduction histidine kinase